MARRKRANKLPIVYRSGSSKVVYVSRAPDELFTEAKRVWGSIQVALRQLKALKRTRHSALRGAVWQLSQVEPPLKEANTASLVDYIATVSYLMEDSISMLATLKNSKIDELEEARFHLTYGQTPKKRDRDDTMCSKPKRHMEVYEDGE